MSKRCSRGLGAGLSIVAVGIVLMASVAFACTTYQGKMTVTAGGASSISQGNNNCDVSCGAANGSMRWCNGITLGAHVPASTGGSATVTMATTTACVAHSPSWPENHLAGSTTFDINYINVDYMLTSTTTVGNPGDCMSWNGSGGMVNITTATTTSGGGFTKSITIPSGTANTGSYYSGLCVSSSNSDYGNQAGVQFT